MAKENFSEGYFPMGIMAKQKLEEVRNLLEGIVEVYRDIQDTGQERVRDATYFFINGGIIRLDSKGVKLSEKVNKNLTSRIRLMLGF
ncbi:hypothetical protein J4225_03960 [Candidatus Pacearchaeota archaeon]|nr:hypothetical protein [Candidatus Pacearchaeota archaeon]